MSGAGATRPALEPVSSDELELGELSSSIGFLLRLAQVRIFDAFHETFAQLGLRPGEYTVLWLIELNPGVQQGVLARQLSIKAAHMTKLVQRLVEAGYVSRHTSERDRRSVHLSLSEVGTRFVERHKAAFEAFRQDECGALSKTEAAQLRRLLCKFNALPVRS